MSEATTATSATGILTGVVQAPEAPVAPAALPAPVAQAAPVEAPAPVVPAPVEVAPAAPAEPETLVVNSTLPWGLCITLEDAPYVLAVGQTVVPAVSFRAWLADHADFAPVERGLIAVGG